MAITELAGRERARARRRRWIEESAPEPIVRPEAAVQLLTHELSDELRRFGTLPHRAALERDGGYQRHRAEISAVLRGYQWDLRSAAAPSTCRPGRLRAAAWNIERGKRFETVAGVLAEHPRLRELDLVLLTEVDHGVGRSGNLDVASRLAERLSMGHVFAPSHLLLSAGDHAEQDHGVPNTLAMHGVALLTRFPVRRLRGVGLPEYADKLGAVERRLGAKRALLAELEAPGGPLTVAVVHLDPFAPPRHRAWQMQSILAAVSGLHQPHLLLGGDLNTNTYHLGDPKGLVVDVLSKLLRLGFAGTVAHYMIPEQQFERGVFETMAEAGLHTEGFVDPSTGTYRFDLNDPETVDKALSTLSGPVVRWLQRRLEPWGGTVPLRMDWFAGRGLQPRAAWTVGRPRY
ncbi:MAG: endonuclease/exonuclease/phosphatase family protein, partial [Nannocystaceae bacterium]